MKKQLLGIACCVAMVLGQILAPWSTVLAAADLDLTTQPYYVFTVTTAATKKILLPNHDIVIAHLGLQDDGSTGSVGGDYVVIMDQADAMVASTAAGKKAIVFSQGSISFRGRDVATGADGVREIHIKAVGHGATLQFIKGSYMGRAGVD